MNKRKQYSSGFTMIELMIVMVIVSSLIGLVGPLAVNSVEKYQKRIEIDQLGSLVFNYSNLSFIKGKSHQLVFKRAEVVENEVLVFEFKYIVFPEQSVVFSSSGIPQVDQLEYYIEDKRAQLDLMELLYEGQ